MILKNKKEMSGNISKTYILDTEGMKTFVKKVPVSKFDTRTLAFQSNLRQYIKGDFNINQYDNIEVVTDGKTEMFYEVRFEHLDEKEWSPNKSNMKLIGESMALIHNHCYRNKEHIALKVKNEFYNKISYWMMLDNKIPFKKEAEKRRREIFKTLSKKEIDQPKIPLHRDFRKHNILYDGSKYHLIDFDFAAVDYVSIEVMSFISDIIENGFANVKSFLEGYLKNINIKGLNPNLFVNDYILYLCTNTFPFYMYESLEEEPFNNLVEDRNNCLETMYNLQDKINKIIEDIQK